ncbi:MAG TPA: AAA family ATPase [Steroidobacteraceae bacterium]|nr:AAA family ATPase [Steroidobacteraceae bacterium]
MSLVEKAIHKLQKQREQSAGESRTSAASQTSEAPRASESAAPHAAAAPTVSPPVVILDRVMLRSAGLMPPEEELDLITRQYRKIKHPLVARAMGRGVPREPKGFLVMIASAMSGEGKSFTAMNLALSFSLEKDVEVLLVDADAPKPHLSRIMGLADAPGLLDVLRDPQRDVESVIHATNVPSLSFMPAGAGADDATELLSSTRMERTAALLGQRDSHRIVVFDSPPLLQTTESPALARVAGQIVVVVRADSTPQPLLLDALNTLQGHASVSLVLNQSMQSGAAPYYYYGYESKGGGIAPADARGGQ